MKGMQRIQMEANIVFDNFQKENKYDIAVFSEQGKRSSQQDSAYVASDDGNVIVVVCDGMGGYEGGQLAGSTAVDAFLEYYQCFGASSDSDNVWMKEAVIKIDDIVFNLEDNSGNRLGAGTTLVGIKIAIDLLSWISVGDSRLYLKRKNEMIQITTDHNYFFDLNRRWSEGKISEEKYMREAESGEALISYIGMGGLTMMDISEEPLTLLVGDILFICTDGVYRSIDADMIRKIMEACDSSSDIANVICNEVKKVDRQDQDNYTGIIIKINE